MCVTLSPASEAMQHPDQKHSFTLRFRDRSAHALQHADFIFSLANCVLSIGGHSTMKLKHTHRHTETLTLTPFFLHFKTHIQITNYCNNNKTHTHTRRRVSFACIMRAHVSAIQLKAIPANTNVTLPRGQRIHLVMHRGGEKKEKEKKTAA